jgi:hypothetical protein
MVAEISVDKMTIGEMLCRLIYCLTPKLATNLKGGPFANITKLFNNVDAVAY